MSRATISSQAWSIIDDGGDPEWNPLYCKQPLPPQSILRAFLSFSVFFSPAIMDEMKAEECCLLLRGREEEKKSRQVQACRGCGAGLVPTEPARPSLSQARVTGKHGWSLVNQVQGMRDEDTNRKSCEPQVTGFHIGGGTARGTRRPGGTRSSGAHLQVTMVDSPCPLRSQPPLLFWVCQ